MKTELHKKVENISAHIIKKIPNAMYSGLVLLTTLMALSAKSQENNTRSLDRREDVKLVSNERSVTDADQKSKEINADIELTTLNYKANLLLNELRSILEAPEKETKFREGLGADITEKASILCPSIDFKHWIFGDKRYEEVFFFDDNEAKSFIELMIIANTDLSRTIN